MGWLFILIGVLLIAIGTFNVYYGQDLVRRGGDTGTQSSSSSRSTLPVLNPAQEKLLSIISDNQREYAATKLVIGRNGILYVDKPKEARVERNILAVLFGSQSDDPSYVARFNDLMEGMPEAYLRRIPEARFDNPYVVSVTDEGSRYLRKK